MRAVRLQQIATIAAATAGPLLLSGCLSLAIGSGGTRESRWIEQQAVSNSETLKLESRMSAIENRLTTVENRVRALREDEAKRQKVSNGGPENPSASDLNAVDAETGAIRSTLPE